MHLICQTVQAETYFSVLLPDHYPTLCVELFPTVMLSYGSRLPYRCMLLWNAM